MKTNKIAIVGHGLVPSDLSERLLGKDDNEIVIIGSIGNEAVKKAVEQLESEGKKITVISEEDFKKRELEKITFKKQEKVYEYAAPMYLENYESDLTKKQKSQVVVPVRTETKYQNNEPCHCGSGLKYKKCCK